MPVFLFVRAAVLPGRRYCDFKYSIDGSAACCLQSGCRWIGGGRWRGSLGDGTLFDAYVFRRYLAHDLGRLDAGSVAGSAVLRDHEINAYQQYIGYRSFVVDICLRRIPCGIPASTQCFALAVLHSVGNGILRYFGGLCSFPAFCRPGREFSLKPSAVRLFQLYFDERIFSFIGVDDIMLNTFRAEIGHALLHVGEGFAVFCQ